MKHNISRGKPDKRRIFKGMRNLAGQSFRGDKEEQNVKNELCRDTWKEMIGTILAQCYITPWAGRAVSVERAEAGCPVTPQGARPYSWRHSRVRHPQAGTRLQFAFPGAFQHYTPTPQQSEQSCPQPGVIPPARHWQHSQHWQQQKFNQTSPQTGQIHRASFVPSVATREIHSSNKSGGAISKCRCAATRFHASKEICPAADGKAIDPRVRFI